MSFGSPPPPARPSLATGLLLLLLSPGVQADPSLSYTAAYTGCRITGPSHTTVRYGAVCTLHCALLHRLPEQLL